jgi:anthranilate/para-aminobenzoate synthase component II
LLDNYDSYTYNLYQIIAEAYGGELYCLLLKQQVQAQHAGMVVVLAVAKERSCQNACSNEVSATAGALQ